MTDSPSYIVCKACNPNDEYPPHEAHVLVWQFAAPGESNWVPSCCNRVLDWWAYDVSSSLRDMKDAGAPERWIIPLEPTDGGRA